MDKAICQPADGFSFCKNYAFGYASFHIPDKISLKTSCHTTDGLIKILIYFSFL